MDNAMFRGTDDALMGARSTIGDVVAYLAGPECADRVHGSRACARAAAFIADCFMMYGLAPLPGGEVLSVRTPPWSPRGRNIFGLLHNPSTDLSQPALVLIAHHDHIVSLSRGPFHGADDNASGVAVLCAAAELLSRETTQGSRPIVFLSTTGEEKKWLGMRHAWKQLESSGLRWGAGLVIDQVGRCGSQCYLGGLATSPSWLPLVDEVATRGLTLSRVDGPCYAGEERVLHERGCPSLFLTSGRYLDYHTPDDVLANLEQDAMAQLSRVVASLAGAISHIESGIGFVDGPLSEPIWVE